jgi:hypothetical protein
VDEEVPLEVDAVALEEAVVASEVVIVVVVVVVEVCADTVQVGELMNVSILIHF